MNIYNAWNGVPYHDVTNFCNANCLSSNALRRADDIKRQIESIMAKVVGGDDDDDDYKGNGYFNNKVTFKLMKNNDSKYYENILKALLSGHFMNIAVKGFGDKFWRFRLLDLDSNGSDKAVDIIDKAKCHRNSIFYKNNSYLTSWVIYHDVSIEHCTQLKMLTAIKPKWLLEIDSNSYYNINTLIRDKTPISQVLKDMSNI